MVLVVESRPICPAMVISLLVGLRGVLLMWEYAGCKVGWFGGLKGVDILLQGNERYEFGIRKRGKEVRESGK